MTGKILLLAGLAGVQVTLLAPVNASGIGPDLVLVWVIYWSARLRLRDSVILAFCGGSFLDLLSILPVGTVALGLLPALFLLDYWKDYLKQLGIPILIATVCLASASRVMVAYLVAALIGYEAPIAAMSDTILPRLLVNSLLLLFILFSSYLFRRGRPHASGVNP